MLRRLLFGRISNPGCITDGADRLACNQRRPYCLRDHRRLKPLRRRVKVYLACKPVDMRRGFDGLAADVAQTLHADPYSGAAFVFRSKRGDYVKILTGMGPACVYSPSVLRRDALSGRHARPHPFHPLRQMPRTGRTRGVSDRRHHRQSKREGRRKKLSVEPVGDVKPSAQLPPTPLPIILVGSTISSNRIASM